MKLRNKKTGEIVEDAYVRETHDFQFDGQKYALAVFKSNGHSVPERISGPYHSLAQLNEEWEDYEEPEVYWFMNSCGEVLRNIDASDYIEGEDNTSHKEIGNYFETKEDAEKAVEKLKAWKRLKDKGFKICGYDFDYLLYAHKDGTPIVKVICDFNCETEEDKKDLDLLFGGEE